MSPNEPITPYGLSRVLSQLNEATSDLEDYAGKGKPTITMWNPNTTYSKGDLVLHFKTESEQKDADVGKREFAFILISTRDFNSSIPNYDLVDGIPDFTKSNWKLLNPLSYLLQDLLEMRKVVKEAFANLLDEHVRTEHGLSGPVEDIESSLVRKDYSNLQTGWDKGDFSVCISDDGTTKKMSNGVMEVLLEYGFDSKANQQIVIEGRRHYYQKSPIWDESDHTIFSRKYMEDNMMSAVLKSGAQFNNLRYGTNIFHKHVDFSTPFVDDEYCVFFDTYGRGDFVFGYELADLVAQEEPSYDAVVSMPMIMNKTNSGFDIVLPIHTHFNSMQKWQIGVPWRNKFRLQAVGRYR